MEYTQIWNHTQGLHPTWEPNEDDDESEGTTDTVNVSPVVDTMHAKTIGKIGDWVIETHAHTLTPQMLEQVRERVANMPAWFVDRNMAKIHKRVHDRRGQFSKTFIEQKDFLMKFRLEWMSDFIVHDWVFVEYMLENAPSDITDCSVCLNTGEGRMVRVAGCGHAFHEPCIQEWLHTHQECPLCRGTAIKWCRVNAYKRNDGMAPIYLKVDSVQMML